MNENKHQTSGYVAATRFLRDHPEPNWLLVLKACVKEARRTKDVGFAGAWVLREAQRAAGIKWFPNLRPLVSAGILQRTEVSRGGKRAYYVMLDPEGVEEALR
jgi:hypothetical protein